MNPFAIVTGCSRGIGAATARELTLRGWDVLGISRGELRDFEPADGFHHQRLDLSDLRATEDFFRGEFESLAQLASRPRVGLVNNAGRLDPVGPLARVSLLEFDVSMRLNASVPIWLAGRIAASVAHAPCRIVSLSSGAATSPYPGWGPYCASKAALRLADEVLGVELAEFSELAGRDTRVFSYAPGVVATAMQEQIRAVDIDDFPRRARFEELHANRQLADPSGPARQIADLLESNAGPQFQALRYEA